MTNDISTITIEASCGLLIISVAYKIYKMRCNSSSNCCGEAIHIDTHNPGGQSPRDIESQEPSGNSL